MRELEQRKKVLALYPYKEDNVKCILIPVLIIQS